VKKIDPWNIKEHDDIDNLIGNDRRILYQPVGKAKAYTINKKKRYR
jgi:hypothetical protein